jgi:hypothetical protein
MSNFGTMNTKNMIDKVPDIGTYENMTCELERDGLTRCDLEQYRRAHGLSYERLAERLSLSSRRRAMAWAIGEVWPDADKLQRIFDATGGEVSLEAMHRRRLSFLADIKGFNDQRQLSLTAE